MGFHYGEVQVAVNQTGGGVWEGGEWGRKKTGINIGGCKIKVRVSAKDVLLQWPTISMVRGFTSNL